MRLTLEALEVLDAIDRKGSFAAAADSLYKVQSKVSYTVRKLEEDIGVPIFIKEGRKSVLTPAGKVLLEQGRALLDAAKTVVENTRQTALGWESSLCIAVDSVLDMSRLYPLLEAFDEIHPEIEISLFEEVLGGSWEAVMEGKASLIIGAPEIPINSQGLEIKHVGDVNWVFAVSKHHPLAKKTILTEADIQQYRAVIVRDSSKHLPPLSRRVFDKQAQIIVPTVEAKIQAQVAGRGIGFLPEFRIQNFLKRGDLVKVAFNEAVGSSPLHIAWKKNNNGKALKWFADKLTADFSGFL